MRRALIALMMAGLAVGRADAQTLKATPVSLSFQYTLGAATLPAAQTLAVAPTSGASLFFTVLVTGGAWVTVTPDNGRTNATLKVQVNPTSLPVGTYAATVVLTPTGGTALNVPVTLSVKAPPATLMATPSPVTVSYTRGDVVPDPIALSLTGGGALLSYTLTISGATWLTATPKSGIIFPAFSSQVALMVDPAGLAPGTYKGTVKIDSPSAANKTQSVDVNLTVNPGPPVLTAVFPTGATVGSAAVTVTLTGSNFYPGSTVTAGSTTLVANLLGPSALQAAIPASLMATAGTVLLKVTNPNPGGGVSATQSFTVYPPGPRITSVTNGASFQNGSVAPGEFVSIFGTGLGPDTIVPFQPPAGGAPIASTLAGVQVMFGATPAPLIFVSSTQIAAMVPYGVTGAFVAVTVQYNAATSLAYPAVVAAAAPGLFALGSSGAGAAAAFNVNETTGELTLNSEANQALKGSTIWLFGTGVGVTAPAGSDGAILSAETPYTSPAGVLNIGGTDVTMDYFGHAPGYVSGLVLIKTKVPSTIAAGRAVPVTLTVSGVASQTGVTIAVK
ncbi:MAG: hypothetical protein HY858_12885 [Candidatus Solibacter usitatus]|nr:hypothetical protein [Candidatus Solibacter usitatus]